MTPAPIRRPRTLRRRARLLLAGVLLAAGLAAPASAQGPADAVARGDRLMAAFDTPAAIAAYREGLAAWPDDPTLLWKTARALSNRADETPGEDGDEALYEEAVELARRAVRAGPDVARAHTTLAAALGKLALFRGGKRKVELAKEVKAQADRAITLDASDFAPFAILGVWNREIATLNVFLKAFANAFFGGVPDASLDRSRRFLERAVALAPETIAPRLELARTLLEADDEAGARRELRIALALEPRESLDRVLQRRARRLLEKIGG